jgi:hypothetical protein
MLVPGAGSLSVLLLHLCSSLTRLEVVLLLLCCSLKMLLCCSLMVLLCCSLIVVLLCSSLLMREEEVVVLPLTNSIFSSC